MLHAAPKPDPTEVNEAARAYIRTLPCVRCLVLTGAKVYGCECAHVRTKRNNGDVANLIPLCKKCHAFQHRIGIQSFAKNVGADLRKAAQLYWDGFLHSEPAY